MKKAILKNKILHLKNELANARMNTYVGNTTDLYVVSGELYINYGDNGEKTVVMCTEQLFKDLPFIINQVIKDNAKMQKMHLNNIVTELKEIDYSILMDDFIDEDEDDDEDKYDNDSTNHTL